MKGFKILTCVFSTLVFISGCASTNSEIISEKNGVIHYQSRCGIVENTKQENLDQSLISIKQPKYPIKAARNGTQGYAKLEFDISDEGKTININVIKSYPSSVFNAAAIEALSNWVYKPKAVSCHYIQLDFKMG